jgi:DNA repair ATPase RecN
MSEETKSVLEGAVSDLDASQLALDDKLRDALTALDSAFKALDGVTDSYTAQAKRLRQVKDIAREMKSIPDEIEAKILNLETRLGKLSAARPKTGSLFLRFALGKVNARVWKRSEVIQLKSEYNKFKHRTTFVFILLPLLQIFFPTKLLAS